MGEQDKPSTAAIILGFAESVITYFSVGFTTIALASYVHDGTVDVGKSLIVGSALALMQVARFILDVLRDARGARKEASH